MCVSVSRIRVLFFGFGEPTKKQNSEGNEECDSQNIIYSHTIHAHIVRLFFLLPILRSFFLCFLLSFINLLHLAQSLLSASTFLAAVSFVLNGWPRQEQCVFLFVS